MANTTGRTAGSPYVMTALSPERLIVTSASVVMQGRRGRIRISSCLGTVESELAPACLVVLEGSDADQAKVRLG
jgi:hypothetical protein